MAHWREDGRWLKLGIHYAKSMRVAQKLFSNMSWLEFQRFAVMFENGSRHLDDLETRRTGRMGAIIPKNTDFLRMPEVFPRQSSGRLMH